MRRQKIYHFPFPLKMYLPVHVLQIHKTNNLFIILGNRTQVGLSISFNFQYFFFLSNRTCTCISLFFFLTCSLSLSLALCSSSYLSFAPIAGRHYSTKCISESRFGETYSIILSTWRECWQAVDVFLARRQQTGNVNKVLLSISLMPRSHRNIILIIGRIAKSEMWMKRKPCSFHLTDTCLTRI